MGGPDEYVPRKALGLLKASSSVEEWDDQGWFAMTKSKDGDLFPFGLMDVYVDGYQDGLAGQ